MSLAVHVAGVAHYVASLHLPPDLQAGRVFRLKIDRGCASPGGESLVHLGTGRGLRIDPLQVRQRDGRRVDALLVDDGYQKAHLKAPGAEVRVAAPPPMIPPGIEALGVKAYTSLRESLEGADVVMALRIQNERLVGSWFPSVREYSATFGLDRAKLHYARDGAIVMHPGPVNRGVELSHDLADHRPSVILDQVRNGVAIRLAVLYLFAGRGRGAAPETREDTR